LIRGVHVRSASVLTSNLGLGTNEVDPPAMDADRLLERQKKADRRKSGGQYDQLILRFSQAGLAAAVEGAVCYRDNERVVPPSATSA
jgi:hypothetical protein